MTDPLHGTGGHTLLYPHLAPIPEASATEAAPEANRDLSATDTLGAARAAADRGPEAPKREFLVFMPKGGGPEGMVNTLKRIQSKVQARNSCDRSGRYVVTLTDAEAAQYKNAGMRVMEDYVYHLPPPIETAEANVTPLNESVIRQVNGVERVHRELGWEGEDLLFIMIDTGIGENEFLPRPALYDDMLTAEPNDPPRDPQGHGTFGSGIAVANGNAENGEIRGVAPKATLAGMNVFEPSGGARVSTILAALDRAIEWANRDEWKDKPVVVNLSLGGRAIGDRADSPLVQMINEMVREHGIFVSAAAGNSGPGLGTISDPAWAETAMAFAASNHLGTETTADDRIEDFSSHGDPDGPPGQNDKPDIAAAGVQRVSTRSGGGTAVSSGTSFSSPEGGAAAGVLLAGAYGLHQEGLVKTTVRDMVRSMEIHDIFKETAFDMPNEPAYAEGAGDMRVYDAALLMLERHSTLNIVEREGTFRELIETLKEDDGVLDSRDQLDILTGLSKLASEITAPSERLEFLSRAREIYTAASADLAPHTVTRLASVATELACEAASELASASPLSAKDAAAAWDTVVAWRAGGDYGAMNADHVFELSRLSDTAVANMTHSAAADFLTVAMAHVSGSDFDGKEDLDQSIRAQAYKAFEAIAAAPSESPDVAVQNLTRYAEWLTSDTEHTNRGKTAMLRTALTKAVSSSPDVIRLDVAQAFRTWSLDSARPGFIQDMGDTVDRLTVDAIERRAEKGFADANEAIGLMQQVWNIHLQDGVRTNAEDGEFFELLRRTIDQSRDQFVQSAEDRAAFRAGVSGLLETVKPMAEDTAAMASWRQLRTALYTRLSDVMVQG